MHKNQLTSVVITRPLARAAGLVDRLIKLNLRPVSMPLMETVAAGNPVAIKQLINAIMPLDWAIFTSIAAVEYGTRLLTPDQFAGTRVAAIGSSTARALNTAGFDQVLLPAAGYTSEALLEAPEFNQPDAGKVAIFCAPGGRRLLFDRLSQRGWQVVEIPVYQRIALTPDRAAREEIINSQRLIVIFTSAAAMAICKNNLPAEIWEALCRTDWVVVSRRLADKAGQFGANRVHIANGPDNRALAETVAAVSRQI